MENKNETSSCSCAAEADCGCGSKGCLPCCPGEMTLAFWVLRLWLGIRAVVTGIEKFSVLKVVSEENEFGGVVEKTVRTYEISGHHGLPGALAKQLGDLPLMPNWGLAIFDATLGYVLIALGVMLLAGIGTRISLFLQGILYSMLTVGLIMLNQDAGIAWLGIHLLLIAGALVLAKHNKLAVLKKF